MRGLDCHGVRKAKREIEDLDKHLRALRKQKNPTPGQLDFMQKKRDRLMKELLGTGWENDSSAA